MIFSSIIRFSMMNNKTCSFSFINPDVVVDVVDVVEEELKLFEAGRAPSILLKI